jgi:hypothetical protein
VLTNYILIKHSNDLTHSLEVCTIIGRDQISWVYRSDASFGKYLLNLNEDFTEPKPKTLLLQYENIYTNTDYSALIHPLLSYNILLVI